MECMFVGNLKDKDLYKVMAKKDKKKRDGGKLAPRKGRKFGRPNYFVPAQVENKEG